MRFGTFVGMNRWIVLLLLVLASPRSSQAQEITFPDTLLTLSGRDIPCVVIDSLGPEIRFEVVNRRGKTKTRFLDRGEIFSIRDTAEHMIYVQDTLIGNWMTEEQVRIFITGEKDARECYKVNGTFWLSFGLSAAASYWSQGGLITPLIMPLAITGYQLIPVLRIPGECLSNPSYTWNDTYALGFEKVARPMRIMAALKGGGLGMALGIAGFYIVPL